MHLNLLIKSSKLLRMLRNHAPTSSSVAQRLWLAAILFLVICFYCYEFFLRISPSVVLDTLMTYFNFSAFGIGLISSAYYCAYTLGQIPAGILLDRYHPKYVLSVATVLCALGSYFFIYSNNEYLAITSRFIIMLH